MRVFTLLSSPRLLPLGLILMVLLPGGLLMRSAPAAGDEATGVTSVVELFTSQGCSSCPPADRLLESMARAPDFLGLSFPVDYWDYLGWRDTLASPTNTDRQRAYAAARGSDQVYTPQAIIDGLADAIGSDQADIEQQMRNTRGHDGAMTVSIRMTEEQGMVQIAVGAGPQTAAGVYLLRVLKSKAVAIGRGENIGSTVTYTNVVRTMKKIGDWNGAAQSFEVADSKGEDEGTVVLVQKGSEAHPGAILAAAKSAGL